MKDNTIMEKTKIFEQMLLKRTMFDEGSEFCRAPQPYKM
jgi:hypothetical protein